MLTCPHAASHRHRHPDRSPGRRGQPRPDRARTGWATMRRIAAVSGVSSSSIFHQLGSREHLLRVAAGRTSKRRLSSLQAASLDDGVLGFLPRYDDELLDARAWLAWQELWRSEEFLGRWIAEGASRRAGAAGAGAGLPARPRSPGRGDGAGRRVAGRALCAQGPDAARPCSTECRRPTSVCPSPRSLSGGGADQPRAARASVSWSRMAAQARWDHRGEHPVTALGAGAVGVAEHATSGPWSIAKA